MIELNELKQALVDKLTELGTSKGITFHIVSDTGEYKHPERIDNKVIDYTNGVFTLTSSDIANLTDGTVIATQTARLDVIVRLPDLTADEKYNNVALETVEAKINNVRDILNTLTQSSTYTKMTDASGVEYTVSTIYQNAVSGERNIIANVGDSFTFSVSIYYMLIQGGVNTRDITLNIDGYTLPYQAMTINHSKTYDSNVYSDTTNGSVKNIALQSNLSISFELPAVQGVFFREILSIIIGNDKLNTAHCLNIDVNGTNKSFLVNVGEVNLNAETVKNAGLKVTFFEAPNKYYLIGLPSKYYVYESKESGYKNIAFKDDTAGFYFFASNNIANIYFLDVGEGKTQLMGLTTIVTSSELIDNSGFDCILEGE